MSNRKDVFTILPPYKEGGKNRWVRIGSAFVNRDESITVKLDALPTTAELNIRDPKERDGQQDYRSRPPANDDDVGF